VRSHRWIGGDHIDDRQLAEEVIRRMAGVAQRAARIRAAAMLVYRDAEGVREAAAEATLEGVIADRCYPQVRAGFPYRAVLYLPDRGRYLAELSEEAAAELSQRRALIDELAGELRRLAATPTVARS
jgi:inosine/xanthosine triphosphate pyrophosphatase family protein